MTKMQRRGRSVHSNKHTVIKSLVGPYTEATLLFNNYMIILPELFSISSSTSNIGERIPIPSGISGRLSPPISRSWCSLYGGEKWMTRKRGRSKDKERERGGEEVGGRGGGGKGGRGVERRGRRREEGQPIAGSSICLVCAWDQVTFCYVLWRGLEYQSMFPPPTLPSRLSHMWDKYLTCCSKFI